METGTVGVWDYVIFGAILLWSLGKLNEHLIDTGSGRFDKLFSIVESIFEIYRNSSITCQQRNKKKCENHGSGTS